MPRATGNAGRDDAGGPDGAVAGYRNALGYRSGRRPAVAVSCPIDHLTPYYTDGMGPCGRPVLRLLLTTVLAVTAAQSPLTAESERRPADLSSPLTLQLLHQQNLAAREAKGLEMPRTVSLAVQPEPVDELIVDDIGNLAVVDDGEGVFLPPLDFDLNGKTLAFLPADEAASGYTYATRDGGYDSQAAADGEFVVLGDDDSLLVPLPFAFPYFGETYEEVFLNSDGNLTFLRGDSASTFRDPARAVSGPPRILPLFIDLDPTTPGGAIRVLADSDRWVVTWINIAEFSFTDNGLPQNFQVSLFADGRIEFAYRDVTALTGIVGIASGTRLNESQAVDFSESSDTVFEAAVVEIFVPAVVDLAVLSQKFYLNHEDAYDFLVIFHNYELPIETGAFAFCLPIRNFVQGIGPFPSFLAQFNITDFGAFVGSPQRLQGLIFMGLLDNYPDNPNDRIDRSFGLGVNTPLTVLSHEVGHRFLANVLFVDPETNQFSAELLGRQLSHWSYYFNSDASLLEGNRIADRGSGPFQFETIETTEAYSPLDLYLWGVVPPEQVPPSFFVRDPSIADNLFTSAHEPLAGIFFDGERVDVTLEMIREAHGRRIPDQTVSQKNFRYGFILLKEEGEEVPEEDAEKIDTLREAFEGRFKTVIDNRAVAETELVRKVGLTTWPASGVLQGSTQTAAVFLGRRTVAPVTVALGTDNGVVDLPETVTIPAGAQFVNFPITGVSPGVARLTAAVDDEYEVSYSNIQVLGDASTLSSTRLFPLEIIFGDPRERLRTGRVGAPMPFPYFIQVFDDNFLAYKDVPFEIKVSGDGRVNPPDPVSDAFGFIVVDWTLATTPGENTMAVAIPGSRRPPLVITAVGVRSPPRHRNFRDLLFGF